MCGSWDSFGKNNNNFILLTKQAGFAVDGMPFVGAHVIAVGGLGEALRTRLRRAKALPRVLSWAGSALTRGAGCTWSGASQKKRRRLPDAAVYHLPVRVRPAMHAY
ncbi:hypothetical protein [Xanthomonas euvesicatoria]|uniref:hypothetical protein n=1 Tax=Xanthomonas euvesicatoria TaxID=456327 RepID=UPI001C468561|nr:hypothetical protein [Xanthomonas euvesicatoria]